MNDTITQGANWWGLAGFALLVAAFGIAFLVLTILPQRRNAQALRSLAQRRGWQIERASGAMRKGQGSAWFTDVHPTDGAGWQCRVTLAGQASRQIRTTEFSDRSLPAPTGMIVIGPPMEATAAHAAGQFLGQFAGPLGSLALAKLLGDQADGIEQLRPVQGISGMGVFATSGLDAADLHHRVAPLIGQWCAAHPAEKDFPILIWGAQGCRLRLRTDATDAVKLEAFLDHAQRISAALRVARP